MTGSRITNVVVGGIAIDNIVVPTNVSTTSGSGEAFTAANTKTICSPNSLIKYINYRFQTGIKQDVGNARNGWIEYAIVVFDEQSTAPVVSAAMTAAIGTQTLGEIMTNLFRGKAIWNGAFEIAKELPRVVDVPIKIPQKYSKNAIGKYLAVFYTYRTSLSTDTTSEVRFVNTWQYKCYM